jgi:hypothetical protein
VTTLDSQQVSWWEVHEFVGAVAAQANCGALPWPGTPAWCEMSAGDPRKLLALAQFGVHHALRVETAQQARCDASRAVSAAADWSAIGRERLKLNAFFAARPWLTRAGGHHS